MSLLRMPRALYRSSLARLPTRYLSRLIRLFFFFSSRRRHTRSLRDWSSDVCSSDLHREFFSLDFRVTPDVLIPRPETEFLVLTALDQLKARDDAQPASLADVGTGSGNIDRKSVV